MVIYAVGTYESMEDALGRKFDLELKGFDDTYILVDNNGTVSNYVNSVSKLLIDEEVVVPNIDEIKIEKVSDQETVIYSKETTYRIQIGAFDKELSDKVFKGVDNVISFSGKDGVYRYMAGSFTEYKDVLMTAAGTVKAAKVLVLGAGVAGLQAVATAKRLGAVVEASDVRPAVQEQIESLGAKFIEVPFETEEEKE